LPEIEPADVKAVRQFLTSLRAEERQASMPRLNPTPGGVPLRNGIARARNRSATKSKP
jgi:hypothetical protein